MYSILLLSFFLLGCTQNQTLLSTEDKNTHKIQSNKIEAKKAQEEYAKLKSSY